MSHEVVLSSVEIAEASRFSYMPDYEAVFNGLVSVCVGLANRRGFVGEDMKNLPVEEKDDIAFLVMLAVARHGNQKLIVDVPNHYDRLIKKFDEFIEMC